MKRGGRLPAQSAKRKAERAARTDVREATLARAGHRCEATEIVPEIECWGPLDVDERKSRGVYPGGHLDLENTQALCRGHHQWRTENPEEARKRGLRLAAGDPSPNLDTGSPNLDETGATIPEPAPLQGVDQAALQRLPKHVARAGTVDWMCKAIEMNGERYYGATSMIADGIEIPADVLTAACAADDGGEPFEPDICFCCVDAEGILDGLGLTYRYDEIGDLVVTGTKPDETT